MPGRLASGLRGRFQAWWLRAKGSRAVPAELRAQLALCRGEQILAAARRPDGDHALIATDRAIHHQAGPGSWSRLGWDLITSVEWDGDGRLVITGLDGFAPARTVVALRDRGALQELAQERIAHTWLGCWTVTLADRRRVSVEVRRRPWTDELLWAVLPQDGANCAGTGSAGTGSAGTGSAGTDGRDMRAQVDWAVAGLADHLGVAHLSRPDRQAEDSRSAAHPWPAGPR
jgi:hypothetical protein